MKEEIITKLKSALGEPIEKEKDVVYILSKIRKLLERNNIKSTYPILKFYCDWALHSEIGNTSSIRPVLEKIEQGIINKNWDVRSAWNMVDFEEFCREIGLFLKNFNINNPFTDRKYWNNFRNLFVDILVDCPLKPNYGDMDEFRFIKSSERGEIDFIITFKKDKNGIPKHIPIRGSFSILDANEIFDRVKNQKEKL